MAEVAPLTSARVKRRQVLGHSRVFGRRTRCIAKEKNVSAGKMPLKAIKEKARGKLLIMMSLPPTMRPTITRTIYTGRKDQKGGSLKGRDGRLARVTAL